MFIPFNIFQSLAARPGLVHLIQLCLNFYNLGGCRFSGRSLVKFLPFTHGIGFKSCHMSLNGSCVHLVFGLLDRLLALLELRLGVSLLLFGLCQGLSVGIHFFDIALRLSLLETFSQSIHSLTGALQFFIIFLMLIPGLLVLLPGLLISALFILSFLFGSSNLLIVSVICITTVR